jgi:hypothetical protein
MLQSEGERVRKLASKVVAGRCEGIRPRGNPRALGSFSRKSIRPVKSFAFIRESFIPKRPYRFFQSSRSRFLSPCARSMHLSATSLHFYRTPCHRLRRHRIRHRPSSRLRFSFFLRALLIASPLHPRALSRHLVPPLRPCGFSILCFPLLLLFIGADDERSQSHSLALHSAASLLLPFNTLSSFHF